MQERFAAALAQNRIDIGHAEPRALLPLLRLPGPRTASAANSASATHGVADSPGLLLPPPVDDRRVADGRLLIRARHGGAAGVCVAADVAAAAATTPGNLGLCRNGRVVTERSKATDRDDNDVDGDDDDDGDDGDEDGWR